MRRMALGRAEMFDPLESIAPTGASTRQKTFPALSSPQYLRYFTPYCCWMLRSAACASARLSR